MKVVLIFLGCCFGLRGSKEHTMLAIDNVAQGWYAKDHPHYGGQEWWGLTGLTDKTLKLSTRNHHVRDQRELGRFPVLDELAMDIGGCIKGYTAKVQAVAIPKGQEQCRQLHRRISARGDTFENHPLGHNVSLATSLATSSKLARR